MKASIKNLTNMNHPSRLVDLEPKQFHEPPQQEGKGRSLADSQHRLGIVSSSPGELVGK